MWPRVVEVLEFIFRRRCGMKLPLFRGIFISAILIAAMMALLGNSAKKEEGGAGLQGLFRGADEGMLSEKHVPVIAAPKIAEKGKPFTIKITVGPHPNTTEHHICYVEVFFLPTGEQFPSQLGRFEFTSHGASVRGGDTSTVYTEPTVEFEFKTDKPGTIYASSYCNWHGLWQSAKELKVK
jgi:superoxide reductase